MIFLKISILNLSFFIMNIVNAGYEVQIIPLDLIMPSQVRYSIENVKKKATKAQRIQDKLALGVQFDPNDEDVVPVVAAFGKFYLIDGHHTVLAFYELRAKFVPVKILDQYESSSNEADFDFWNWMLSKNYSHQKLIDGTSQIPTTFDAMIDDPIRFFVAVSARKFEKQPYLMETSTGAEYPLWIKVGQDVPFIEFKVADYLYAHGFRFNYGEEKTSEFQFLIEQARAILKLAGCIENPKDDALKEFKLVTTKVHFANLDFVQQLIAQS